MWCEREISSRKFHLMSTGLLAVYLLSFHFHFILLFHFILRHFFLLWYLPQFSFSLFFISLFFWYFYIFFFLFFTLLLLYKRNFFLFYLHFNAFDLIFVFFSMYFSLHIPLVLFCWCCVCRSFLPLLNFCWTQKIVYFLFKINKKKKPKPQTN